MSNLIAIAYPDLATAQQVAANLDEARKGHLVDLDDLVLIEHRDNGKIKLHQPSMATTGALGARPGAGSSACSSWCRSSAWRSVPRRARRPAR